MTNELEKQFFDTFGIEPKKEYYCPSCDTKLEEWKTEKGLYYMCGNCCECDYVLDSLDEEFEEILKNLSYRTEYPQITDTHYLKLISIMSKELSMIVNLLSENIQELKSEILDKCIRNYHRHKEAFSESHRDYADDFKHQVRTLFEEG